MSNLTRRSFITAAAGASIPFPAPAQEEPSPSGTEVNLILIGDWGASEDTSTNAEKNADLKAHRLTQKRTAGALGAWMADEGLAAKIDGLMLLGDNFYGRLKDVNDSRWQKTFLNHFTPQLFPMDMYVALGNHDQEDAGGMNWKAEIDYARTPGKDKRWRFPTEAGHDKRTWYRLDLPTPQAPLVSIMVFNTSSDRLKEKAAAWHIEGWNDQTAWLAAELQKPRTAPWLAGAGHYPMFTNGHHYPDTLPNGDDHTAWKDGRTGLMQPLRAAGAQFWLGAHDHNLQFLHDTSAPSMEFIVSGGGGGDSSYSKLGEGATIAPGDVFEPGPGWVWITFTKQAATTRIYSLPKGEDTPALRHLFKRPHGSATSVREAPPA